MRILIIDQCSGSKDYPSDLTPFKKDVLDDHSRSELLERDDTVGIEAKKLYTGRQQQKIDEAVQMLERDGHEVERYYISAGFGLVHEHDCLPPYEVTFSDMSGTEIDTRAAQLDIVDNLTNMLEAEIPYDIAYFALGSDYYRSIELESSLDHIPDESTAVVFNQAEVAEKYQNVVSIPARTDDAKQFGTIVVALKGVYLKNLARELDTDEVPSADCLIDYCKSEESSQTGFGDFS